VHVRHVDCVPVEYVPALHAWQPSCNAVGICPDGQFEHVDAPPFEYWVEAHCTHVAEDVAPVAVE